MNPWYAKALFLAATVALVAIRAPHGQRSRSVAVVRSAKSGLEKLLLVLAWIAFFVPVVWVPSGALAAWDHPLRPGMLAAGAVLYAFSLWLFWRSHADLGTNWSITLEVREGHCLVTGGVYRRIRHPMYTALLLFSAAQALTIPNLVAGPSYLVVITLLVALRLGPEERLMRETFGTRYVEYSTRSKRLVPGIF
jgi:protein-S-isoprenylcysteine O-methyltransferase Ste14